MHFGTQHHCFVSKICLPRSMLCMSFTSRDVGVALGVGNPVQVFVPYANASTTNETAKYLDSHLVHTGQFFSTDARNTYVRPPPLPTAFLQMCVYVVCVPNITQIHCLPGTVPLCCSVCPTRPTHTVFCKCTCYSPCPAMQGL